MSARWRRNKKNLKKFNIFKVFSKSKDKSTPRIFRIKSTATKRAGLASKYKTRQITQKELKEPRPLADILESSDEIAVVAEFAGFDKESLRIQLKQQKLTLSARASERKYRKSLNLPKRVIPETLCTRYKNGVLEIRLKKALEQPVDRIAG